MSTIGIGNALADVIMRLKDEALLGQLQIRRGSMNMIDADRMRFIRNEGAALPRTVSPGGSVCNSMRSLSRLGETTGYIGKIGKDEVGTYFEKALKKSHVEPCLMKCDEMTGSCTVLVSPDGEKSMCTYLGPGPDMSPEEIPDEMLLKYDTIYVEGYLFVNEHLVRTLMQRAKSLGLTVALDLSNFNIVNAYKPLFEELISQYVDILFSNEDEAVAFTGKQPAEALECLSSVVKRAAVITVGKEGVMASDGRQTVSVAAMSSEPIDTTGAGDNFAAGFLYGFSKKATLRQCLEIGSTLSAEVIHVIGAEIPEERWQQIALKVADVLHERRQ